MNLAANIHVGHILIFVHFLQVEGHIAWDNLRGHRFTGWNSLEDIREVHKAINYLRTENMMPVNIHAL